MLQLIKGRVNTVLWVHEKTPVVRGSHKSVDRAIELNGKTCSATACFAGVGIAESEATVVETIVPVYLHSQ